MLGRVERQMGQNYVIMELNSFIVEPNITYGAP